MLNAKKPLVAKTTLKAKKPIGKGDGKRKQLKPTITLLKKEATKQFNRAVKYRDSEYIEGEWLFKCITCDRRVLFKDREGRYLRTAHAGHFMPVTYSSTRFEEENVNGQCGICNYNQGEQVKYARGIDLKYGIGTAHKLEKMAGPKQWTIPELQEIVHDSKEIIAWHEAIPIDGA